MAPEVVLELLNLFLFFFFFFFLSFLLSATSGLFTIGFNVFTGLLVLTLWLGFNLEELVY